MVLLLSVPWVGLWTVAEEGSDMRTIPEALPASPSHKLPQHKGMGRGLPEPSLFHREIRFPTEVQLYQAASISFIYRRKDANGSRAIALVP